MKGLMFNVLESLAHAAGCSDEAWELVVEFAAAESLLEQASGASFSARPSLTPLSYASPTEAMVRCLSHGDARERTPRDLAEAAQHPDWFSEDWTNSSPGATLTDASRFGVGFSAEAFLQPDVLLGNWHPEPSEAEEDELAEHWIRQTAEHKRRG